MEFKRPIYYAILERLRTENRLIQVISGPRQIGKTTLVKQLFEESFWKGIYVVADGISQDTSWLENQYQQAILASKQQDLPVILAIDEIQKVPNWSGVIKRLFDEQSFANGPKVQLILLGSSNWLMQRGISESLAGRFEQWKMTHWTYTELKEAFEISPEEYVYFGAYPGAMALKGDVERWKSYVVQSLIETVITKDVLLMHAIEKPVLMRRLFELGSLYSGKILSYTKIMGQLQEAKNTTTLAHYLDLLEEAGMLLGLQKYAVDAARKRSSSPKWQVMNNAILSSLESRGFDEISANKKVWGQFVESAIGAHLIAHKGSDLKIFYWNESNAEVDFVLQYKEKTIGLEVKISSDKITGLAKFQKQFNPYKVYQLDEKGLSWQQLISFDPRDLF